MVKDLRRVLLHMDALFLVEVGERLLLQPRVEFNLVCCGHNFALFQQALDLGFGEVRDADSASFALLEDLFHGFPCLQPLSAKRLACVAMWRETYVNVVGITSLHLAIAVFWHELVAPSERRRPVHQVEVEIVRLQIPERGIDGGLDVVRVVAVIPQLGGNEDLVTRNPAVLDAFCAGRLGAIAGNLVSFEDDEAGSARTFERCRCACSQL